MPTLSPKLVGRKPAWRHGWLPRRRRGTQLILIVLALLGFCLWSGRPADQLARPHASDRGMRKSYLQPSPLGASKPKWLKAKRHRHSRTPHKDGSKRPLHDDDASTQSGIPPYAGEHANMTLVDYLNLEVGAPDAIREGRGIWMTLADERYVEEFLSHTRLYLDGLQTRPGFPSHDLVVLCLDSGCMNRGRKRKMMPYGGFIEDPKKPSFVRTDTWAKAAGLSQALEAGYHTVFFDADVFFRWDVFQRLPTLARDTWDLQIQDESYALNVNTGFMFTRANSRTAAMWKYVLEQVTLVGDRDQAKINEYLDTTTLREPVKSHKLQRIVSPTGVRVEVLEPKFYWGMHMGWFTNSATTLLHMTCAPPPLKTLIAAAHNFLRDVDGLYSQPPRLLSFGGSMAGSPENNAALFRLLLAAGMESERAVIPPLVGHFVGPADPGDGNVGDLPTGNVTHGRFIWSLFDLEPLLAPSSPVRLVEPNYHEHATPYLVQQPEKLAALHNVRELDLRPINSYEGLLAELDLPYYAHAQHVRLITDEGPHGYKSMWGDWDQHFSPETPKLSLCLRPEVVAGCGDLCRKA